MFATDSAPDTVFFELKIQNQKSSQKSYKIAFVYCVDALGMVSKYSNESQPQNPEFTNKPEKLSSMHIIVLFRSAICIRKLQTFEILKRSQGSQRRKPRLSKVSVFYLTFHAATLVSA